MTEREKKKERQGGVSFFLALVPPFVHVTDPPPSPVPLFFPPQRAKSFSGGPKQGTKLHKSKCGGSRGEARFALFP